MLGRELPPFYRRSMNFLSRTDYKRARTGYNRIRILPIVPLVTGPYHASVS